LGYFFHLIWSILNFKKVAKKDDLLATAGSIKSKKMSHIRLVKEQEDELYTWFLKKRSESLTTSSEGDQKSQKYGTFQIIFDEVCFKGC